MFSCLDTKEQIQSPKDGLPHVPWPPHQVLHDYFIELDAYCDVYLASPMNANVFKDYILRW